MKTGKQAQDDPYYRLRYAEPPPDDEFCHCQDRSAVKLVFANPNPIACMMCNLAVRPDELGLPAALVDTLADWARVAASVYSLWVDSCEYEVWAEQEMVDLDSAVNARGLKLCEDLNRVVSTYYWWFQDDTKLGYTAPRECPLCGSVLVTFPARIVPTLICEQSRLALASPYGDIGTR